MPLSLAERFSRSVVAHRTRWSIGALAVFAAAVAGSLGLSLREDVRDFQPRGAPEADSLELAVRRRLGGADRIVVLLQSDSAMDPVEVAPILDTLAARLSRVRGVQGVQYRVAPRLRSFVESRAPAYLLFAFDTTQLAALASRLTPDSVRLLVQASTIVEPSPLNPGGKRPLDPLHLLGPAAAVLQRAIGGANLSLAGDYLAVPGRRGFLLVVEPQLALSVDSTRRMVRAVEGAAQSVRNDVALAPLMRGKQLLTVGRPVAVVHFFDSAFVDVARVAAASLLLSFLLQWLLFRRVLAPLFLAGTVIYALALTGAAAALLFGAVSLVAWLFISVLVGLGDEFGLYIVSHYWITGATGESRAEALASSLQRPGRGLVYSALAMAVAFGSLGFLSYPVMFQLACITALGLLAMLVASFTVLPIALAYTGASRQPASSRWTRGLDWMHRVGQAHPRRWLIGWLALLLGCAVLARSIRFEPHPWKVALRGNPTTADIERVRQLLGVWPSPILMVSSGATEAEALERDRAAVYQLDRVGSRAGVVTIESLTRWIPPAAQQRDDIVFLAAHQDVMSPTRLRRVFTEAVAATPAADPRLTTEYLPRVLSLLATSSTELTIPALRGLGMDSLVDRHLVRDGSRVLALSYVYLAQSPWTAGVVDRFEETMQMGEGTALTDARFVGDALRGATRPGQLRHDILVATLAAFLLVAVLLAVQFRRLMPALLCLVPLVCGIATALGVMALLGIELNVLTLSIAPLIVGLCVDDGIHLLERLERGEERRQVVHDSGAAIIVTTLTTVTGFACLGMARFPGVRELGLVGSVGIIVALAASLQLVPMLHAMASARGGGPQSPK